MIFAFMQADGGVVTGTVSHLRHLPAASAKVEIQKDGKDIATGFTDASGTYRFTLPSGGYVLKVDTASKSISITSNKTTTVDVDLPGAPQFFDEPQFTVAGVTDNSYRGGHGSDTILRSSETLTKATESLGSGKQEEAEPHHVRAEQEESAGHPLEAVKEFQKAAELNPSERNLFDWGTELLIHKAPEAAAEVFSRGHSQRMILGQATSWYAAGAYEKAAHCFFEAIDSNPQDPTAYLFLFKAQSQEIIQSAGYLERFQKYVSMQPDNAVANYYYGAAVWRARHDLDARTYLQKAVRLDPNLAPAQLELGVVYSQQSQYGDAIGAYQKALQEDPNLEEAHYRLSEAYRLMGEPAKSQQELTRYRELSKDSAEKLEKERRDIQQFVINLKNQ